MKSIFTRPLFINPQAYLTIPELSYIQMATPFDFTEDSYSFVINTSGRIEGKLLKTSNDYILHLDLYSIDGNCVLGEFYLNNSELNTDNFNLTQSKNIITLQFGEQSSGNITYPGLIAAWSAKGKSNDDEDRATLKDLTGNGHDIALNGFTFSEMSGYGGYNTNFLSSNKWITRNYANLKGEYTSSKAILSKGSAGFISNNFRYISYDYLKFRFKTNVNCDLRIYIKANNENDIKTIKVIKDEPTEIEFEDVNNLEGITQRWCYFNISTDNLPEEGLIIEQLSNYPDALVFDGIDDYVSLDAFDGGFKTMFMLVKPFSANRILYDQRKVYDKGDYALYVDIDKNNKIAYNSRNINGTYINNEFSNYRIKDVLNKKQLIMVKSKLIEINKPFIGSSHNVTYFANMALYKFLGFKEALTEEQIQAVIKKYNLLDGVDEIEVS